MACDFCGGEHPGGVPEAMMDRGHPYLTGGGADAAGFVYRVKGQPGYLTSAQYDAARREWQKRRRGEGRPTR